jgi:hypothetical protein
MKASSADPLGTCCSGIEPGRHPARCRYEFRSKYTGCASVENTATGVPARATLFMMFEKPGLKMEPKRGPADVFVIDRLEQPCDQLCGPGERLNANPGLN